MANKTATLTHKVRNPQNLDSWLDIWSADVSADFDENNNRTNETVVITPSSNWEIPADKLTGTVPVTQISNVTSPVPTPEDPNKTETQKNVSIIEPEGNHIAITNENGSISEGPAISSEGNAAKFLNEQGQWITISTDYDLKMFVGNSPAGYNFGNYEGYLKLINNTNNEEDIVYFGTDSPIELSSVPAVPGSTAYGNLNFSLKQKGITANYIADDTITLDNLDLTTLNDPDDSSSGIKFKLPAENMADIPVTQITNFNTEVNNAVSTNTEDNAGIVAKGKYNASKAWLTDSEYKPGWRKVTADHMDNDLELNEKLKDNSISGSKFNTRLLGVFINKNEPYYNEYIDDLYSNPDIMIGRGSTVRAERDVEATFTNVGTITGKMRLYITQSNTYKITINYIDGFLTDSVILVSQSIDTVMIPDLSTMLDWCIDKSSRYWNNTETKYPGYQARFSSTLREQIGNYLTSCLAEPENHPEITYTRISDMFSNDLNKWDYEHCGIWVQI